MQAPVIARGGAAGILRSDPDRGAASMIETDSRCGAIVARPISR
jgi:hypothetical protein